MGEVVAILGAGGHGRDIAAIADAAGVDHVFYDDAVGSDPRPVMYEGWPYVVGVNDPAVRRRMAVGTEPATLIHPTATIDPSATISPGCVVGAGTHIGPATDLGPHTHIGAGCTITRTSGAGCIDHATAAVAQSTVSSSIEIHVRSDRVVPVSLVATRSVTARGPIGPSVAGRSPTSKPRRC